MRVLVINLTRATERHKKMQAQLDAFGLPFEFLEATDGRHITSEQRVLVDHTRRRCITPYPLTDNEIACWLSHQRALQTVESGSESMIVILEDDALLSPDFPHVLAAIEKHDRPFDVIDLHRNFKRGEIFVPVRPLIEGNALGRIGYTHMNLTGYVISRAGACKFLSYAKRFVHAVDKEMHRYWANGLDIYGLKNPIVAHADEGHSYIDESRAQDRPVERERYPNADAPYWQFRQFLSRVSDSVHKRIAFYCMNKTESV